MNFKTHNDDPTIDSDGTSLQYDGYRIAYSRIVEVFGNPEGYEDGFTEADEDEPDEYTKVRAHWSIRFDDGTVASVYDWKEGNPVLKTTYWNIGGKTKRAADLVIAALEGR